jgi:CIC family chloride channel protein
MMRREPNLAATAISIGEFRRRFPLGSTSRVVLVDDAQCYAGIIDPALAFAEGHEASAALGSLDVSRHFTLRPNMDIVEVMQAFDEAQTDELAIVDDRSQVLGILTEAYVRRRYAEELEKAQREMFGE